jgi:hypothetical protein
MNIQKTLSRIGRLQAAALIAAKYRRFALFSE